MHKYLYANGDAINGNDPTGDDDNDGYSANEEYAGYLGDLLDDIAAQQNAIYNLAEDIGSNALNAVIGADTVAATTQPATQSSGTQFYVCVWNSTNMLSVPLAWSTSVGHVAIFDAAGNTIVSEFPKVSNVINPLVTLTLRQTLIREQSVPDQVYAVNVPNVPAFTASAAAQRAMKYWQFTPLGNGTNCVCAAATALQAGGVPINNGWTRWVWPETVTSTIVAIPAL